MIKVFELRSSIRAYVLEHERVVDSLLCTVADLVLGRLVEHVECSSVSQAPYESTNSETHAQTDDLVHDWKRVMLLPRTFHQLPHILDSSDYRQRLSTRELYSAQTAALSILYISHCLSEHPPRSVYPFSSFSLSGLRIVDIESF